jgi:hypothetical protein
MDASRRVSIAWWVRLGTGLLVLAAVFALLWPNPASAEPRFSAQTGWSCGACHVNVTGGGMHTDEGAAFAHDQLPTFASAPAFEPWIAPYARIGGSIRVVDQVTLPAKTHQDDTEYTADGSNEFAIRDASLRLRVDPIPDHLTLYLDETVDAEGAEAREAFALLRTGRRGAYLKFGRFLLPYGLRLADDRAFVRAETGFASTRREVGVEAGVDLEPIAFAVAFATRSPLENAPLEGRRLAATATVTTQWALGGLSVAWDHTADPLLPFDAVIAGAHAGAHYGPAVVLAEVDWLHGFDLSDDFDQVMLYVRATAEVYRGVHLRAGFEAFDPVWALSENERDRFLFGASWFPVPLLEVRAAYRLNRDIPLRVEENADEIVVELHGFL